MVGFYHGQRFESMAIAGFETDPVFFFLPTNRPGFSVLYPEKGYVTTGTRKTIRTKPGWDLYKCDWKTGDKVLVHSTKEEEFISGISEEKNLLYVVAADPKDGHRRLKLIGLETKKATFKRFEDSVPYGRFSPDKKLMAFGVGEETRVVDVETEKTLATMAIRFNQINACLFTPDHKTLITEKEEDPREFQFWDLASGGILGKTVGLRLGVTRGSDFAPDGNTILYGASSTIILVDLKTEKDRKVDRLEDEEGISFIRYSPDGRRFAVGDVRGGVHLYWAPGAMKEE